MHPLKDTQQFSFDLPHPNPTEITNGFIHPLLNYSGGRTGSQTPELDINTAPQFQQLGYSQYKLPDREAYADARYQETTPLPRIGASHYASWERPWRSGGARRNRSQASDRSIWDPMNDPTRMRIADNTRNEDGKHLGSYESPAFGVENKYTGKYLCDQTN